MICTSHQNYLRNEIEGNGVGDACSMYEEKDSFIQGFGRNPEEKGPLGRPNHRLKNNIKMDTEV